MLRDTGMIYSGRSRGNIGRVTLQYMHIVNSASELKLCPCQTTYYIVFSAACSVAGYLHQNDQQH